MAKAGIQFQKKDEYWTPKEVVDFFGPFDYDPATTKEQAEKFGIPYYDTIETDGLKREWNQFGKIWINPPFTRKFEFLQKAASVVEWSHIKIFFLLPIESMTTKRFHQIMTGVPYEMHLPNGRIKFESPEGGGIFSGLWLGGFRIRGRQADIALGAL